MNDQEVLHGDDQNFLHGDDQNFLRGDDQDLLHRCMAEPDNNIVTDPPTFLTMALAASSSADVKLECKECSF